MKKPRSRSRQAPRRNADRIGHTLAAKDKALCACADITTLAELLAAGMTAQGPLDNEVVAHAGRMIARETEKVQAWIRS